MKLIDCDDFDAALSVVCGPYSGEIDARLRERIEPSAMPQNYRELLVHHKHMTTALSAYYAHEVALRVLAHHQDGNIYSRKVLLDLKGTDRVVEFGVMELDLDVVTDQVGAEIVARDAPLGDILIRHDVLRSVDPKWFVRFGEGTPLLAHFGPGVREAFGRIGIIYCDQQPAIELLEVVADRRERP